MSASFSIRLFGRTENRCLLEYISQQTASSRWAENPSCSPDEVESPYLRLGTHPNIVSRLWETVSRELPVRCNWVVYGNPVLVNPRSAIIFGLARGTVYALRFPPDIWAQAVKAGLGTMHKFSDGTVLDLSLFGDGWYFGAARKEEPDWCLRAFSYTDTLRPDYR